MLKVKVDRNTNERGKFPGSFYFVIIFHLQNEFCFKFTAFRFRKIVYLHQVLNELINQK